ncbi:MAG: type II secretion system protein N [Burkholderiaceae bacterium]
MLTNSPSQWGLRGATFGVWALAAACAVYWGLKFVAAPAGSAVAVPEATSAPADPARTALLLGAVPAVATAAPAVNVASRFALVGVAAGVSHAGAALISVDGKPAKPYRVGTVVEDGYVLQSVAGRRAVLAAAMDAAPALTLELPLNPAVPTGAAAETAVAQPPAPGVAAARPVLAPPGTTGPKIAPGWASRKGFPPRSPPAPADSQP